MNTMDDRIQRAMKNFEFERKNWRFNGGNKNVKSHKQKSGKKSSSRKSKI